MSDANPLRTGSTKRFCLYQTLSLRPLSFSTARNEASVQGQGLFPLTDWTDPSVETQTMAAFSQPSQIPIFRCFSVWSATITDTVYTISNSCLYGLVSQKIPVTGQSVSADIDREGGEV